MAKSKYYKAKLGFATVDDNGDPIWVKQGEIASGDSWILKGREDLFEPAETFGRFDTTEVEQATAAPGEKRGKRSHALPAAEDDSAE